MTVHEQVPFITKNGLSVQVDAGLLSILDHLAGLGVETLFSCEGGSDLHKEPAYILMTATGANFLLRRLRKALRLKVLSSESSIFARMLLTNRRELAIDHFLDDGCYRALHFMKIKKSSNPRTDFVIERSLSWYFGHRVCIRWPYKLNTNMNRLLHEITFL